MESGRYFGRTIATLVNASASIPGETGSLGLVDFPLQTGVDRIYMYLTLPNTRTSRVSTDLGRGLPGSQIQAARRREGAFCVGSSHVHDTYGNRPRNPDRRRRCSNGVVGVRFDRRHRRRIYCKICG